MTQRIFVTGGSGFVGSAVIAALVERGYAVNALSNHRTIKSPGDVKTFHGDLFDASVLDQAITGCAAVIHLVGIIMEHPSKGVTFERIHHQGTIAVVDAAQRNGVKRYIHMSALGVRPDAASQYHKTKWKAEEYVRASSLDWTIFRPSMIHGPNGDFMKMEAMWARGKAPAPLFIQPFMPYFGGKSAGLLQPVYVGDVARGFVESIQKPQTVGKTYPLGGAQRLTWPQMHQIIAQAVVGHDRLVAPIPVPVAKFLAAVGIGRLLGFNRDQIIMSQEDNTCDMEEFTSDFGWSPAAMEPTVREYANQL